MLTISNLTKDIGDQRIVDGVSFTVNAGERLGIVGPNGAGKTTLLAMLAGEVTPDDGSVSLQPGKTSGYLRQGFADQPEGRLAYLLDGPGGGLASTYVDVEYATERIADDAKDQESAIEAYDDALLRFEALGGYSALDRLTTTLDRLGLSAAEMHRGFDTPLAQLSGGQKTRAGLAGLLAAQPDMLLLDEPTNHLDLDAIGWLETLILGRAGAAIIVSHDRAFLDTIATSVLALDDLTRRWSIHVGGYSDYLAARVAEDDSQAAAFRRQQERISRIETDIRAVGARASKVEGETQHDYVRGRMKKVARLAVTRERKLERMLASEERIDRPERRWGLAVDLPNPPPSGREVLIAEGIRVAFAGRTVLDDVHLHVRVGERIALCGPNGSGKTTLLRVLCKELTPCAGSVRVGANVVFGRFSQEQEQLDSDRSALAHVRAVAPLDESDARTYLHRFLFSGDMVLRLVRYLSYGERARLALALVVLNGANVLVLDEPFNHLDLPSREQFEAALSEFTGTMLMVLHDRLAIEHLATRVVELRGGSLVNRPR